MSAVSPESRRASANFSESIADLHANGRSSPDGNSPDTPPAPSNADFGPNEWLVDELYQRYQTDPASVDPAWWNFFADYHPTTGGREPSVTPETEIAASRGTAAPAAPPAPASTAPAAPAPASTTPAAPAPSAPKAAAPAA